MSSHIDLAKKFYLAFSKADRDFVEKLLSPRFVFSAPPNPLLNRKEFFEICWKGGAGKLHNYEFIRLIEHGNEVIVTYEFLKPDGKKGRNTEIITFDGNEIICSEVYFGWGIE